MPNGSLPQNYSKDMVEMITLEAYQKLREWFGGDSPQIYPIRKNGGQQTFKVDKITIKVEYNGETKDIYLWDRDQGAKFIKEVRLTFGIKSKPSIIRIDSSGAKNVVKDSDSVMTLKSNTKKIFVDYMINGKLASDIQNEVTKISKQNEKEKEQSEEKKTEVMQKKKEEDKTVQQNFRVPPNSGKCGLINIGNTCYFNSGVQCLLHSLPLARQLLGSNWRSEINENNPLGAKGYLVKAFARLNSRVWSAQESAINPSDLKHVLGDFAPQFQGFEQQDPHELIMFLLDGIHEDLNRCKNKPLVETIIGDGTNDEKTSLEAWKTHKLRNDSIIVDNFHGQLRSRCICPKCHSTTVVFDPFVALSLPIRPINEKVTNVLFIPYEFSEKHEWIRIKLPRESSVKNYEQAIKSIKNVDVAIAFIATTFSGISVYWDPIDAKYAENLTAIALELPSTEQKYIISYLCGTFKSEFANMFSAVERTEDKPVMMPFLVPIDKETSDSKEISAAVSERLSEFWNEGKIPKDFVIKDSELSQYQLKQKVAMRFSSTNFDDNQKIRVKDYFVKDYKPSKFYSNIGSQLFTAIFNGKFMNSENHFDLKLYLKNIGIDFKRSHKGDRESGDVKLEECFDYFRQEEILDENNMWFCPKCREFVCANKKMDLWKASKCLIIHLKRFETTETGTEKDERVVHFPDELDIKPFLAGPVEGNTKYRLYAISEHFGSLGFGHCTAHAIVPNGKGRDWFSFNDSSVKKVIQSNAHTNAAYVLFYERIDNEAEDNAVLVAKPSSFFPENQNKQNLLKNQPNHNNQIKPQQSHGQNKNKNNENNKYFDPNNKPGIFRHHQHNKFDKLKKFSHDQNNYHNNNHHNDHHNNKFHHNKFNKFRH
ncbi:Clan CA, family C19, ubiquitin hydrolase-like cysteine peptidase [Trichomonas vaginalis G3]|uniref:ubiquitinyl hydrolase 1 n=1 Tax=Trichomonas vaginalis (strain ATCC PRA-98 / G3) TaxID=412133 RepID=A2DI27_TRIV3|nr:ubiquitin carboxyl-terminal hydrolase family [Trichomonas vaginalis G3]EAY20016.1 Clan CA, family C19, ubiquitin hydrolase-like cysteine peptidase [Trichomonas vaginalis G3]KAI5525967.1 ubiquitin carboxyl-terminal hydrolase family [Trichomonas vaginalis G3]|eukprot:XP_001581002.1 Clan CA, family C19, ubiquitin hydrolase-like cysteine peptidase [Trichomonas vaginalis G3]